MSSNTCYLVGFLVVMVATSSCSSAVSLAIARGPEQRCMPAGPPIVDFMLAAGVGAVGAAKRRDTLENDPSLFADLTADLWGIGALMGALAFAASGVAGLQEHLECENETVKTWQESRIQNR